MTHNVQHDFIFSKDPHLHRVKFTDAGYDYFWTAAKARVQAKLDNGSLIRRYDRGLSEADQIAKAQMDYYASLQGEAAFALIFDIPMDWDVLTHGDPGYDFKVKTLHFDVKTTTYPAGVLNLHSQEYINTISVKRFAPSLALVLAIRPSDPTKGKAWHREQWVSIVGWLSWMDAVAKAINGEKGGAPMIYVEQKDLNKPSDLVNLLKMVGE